MSARKLVYRFMVFAPVAFLAALGVNGRSLSRGFRFVANDPLSEKRIQNYVPYLRKSRSFLTLFHEPDIDAARSAARDWICGAQKGELGPLVPVAYEDTSSEGAKSEVQDVESRIVGRLSAGLLNDIRANRYHDAFEDGTLILRIADIMKYSDFGSLFNCSIQQRRTVEVLEPIAGKLPAQDREELACTMDTLTTRQKTLNAMVARSKVLFLDWRKRTRCDPLSIEDTQLLSEIPAMVENGTLMTMHNVRDRILASKDDHLPNYCSAVRLGVGAQEHLDTDARLFRAQLDQSASK